LVCPYGTFCYEESGKALSFFQYQLTLIFSNLSKNKLIIIFKKPLSLPGLLFANLFGTGVGQMFAKEVAYGRTCHCGHSIGH
jgi:hypothetical protein